MGIDPCELLKTSKSDNVFLLRSSFRDFLAIFRGYIASTYAVTGLFLCITSFYNPEKVLEHGIWSSTIFIVLIQSGVLKSWN